MRTSFRLIGGALILCTLSQLVACGTILYPERRGQIGGRIDPAIAILDGIGLFFGVIPGLLAFAVDFITGAIYISGHHYAVAPEVLQQALYADGTVNRAKLQEIIYQQTGQQLPLDDPRLQLKPATASQLASLGLPSRA
jgi:hypothetical protein